MTDTDKTGQTDPTIALLRGLRQVRRFRPDPVPPAALTAMLEVGRWTGSGMNSQPWEFVVVKNRETLRAIVAAEGAGSYLGDVPCAVVLVMHGEHPEIVAYDEGRLSERLMLAAAAQGLSAGIWWFKDGGAAAKRLLGIPQDRTVRTALAVGYGAPAPSGGHGGRKPLTELVHDEHY